MTRNPAVHLGLDSIELIFTQMGIPEPEKAAMEFLRKARPYNIKNRYVINGDAGIRTKIERVMSVSGFNGITPENFNALLSQRREAAGHRGITPIRSHDTTAWRQIVEVTQLVNDFSASFEVSAKIGARQFIDIGLQLMKRQYALNKFKYYREKISERYQAWDLVTNDPESETTKEIYASWKALMDEYANATYSLEDYTKYVYMVYVRIECQTIEADPEDWLRAQFEFFKIFDSIPNLGQLVTDTARDRYFEYMAKSKKKIKKITGDVDQDDFMKRYQEKIRGSISND